MENISNPKFKDGSPNMHFPISADPEKYGLPKKADGYAVLDDEWCVYDTLEEAITEHISECLCYTDLQDGVDAVVMSTTKTEKPFEGDYTYIPHKKVKIRLAVTAKVLEEIKVKTDRSHKICQDCPLREVDPPKCDCYPSDGYCMFKPPFE